MKPYKIYYSLNLFRFGCFLAVFMHHASFFAQLGNWGVDAFFILSAFLLTKLLLEEYQINNNFNKIKFFSRRALRIYPLYFFIVGTCTFLAPIISFYIKKPIDFPSKWWYYWLFLSNYDQESHLFALKFLWSIAVEEQFYFLFLFIGSALCTRFWTVIGIMLATYGASVYINLYYSNKTNDLFSHLINFTSGIIAAYYILKFKVSKLIYVFSLSIGCLVAFSFANALLKNEHVTRVLFSIGIACVLIFLTQIEVRYPSVFQHNTISLLDYFGKITFGAYVFSGFVFTIFIKLSIFKIGSWQYILSSLLITLAISCASYELYEKHWLALKRKFR